MSPSADPFFSIVVSTFNREEIIQRCVKSCLRQDHPSFEVVVVDDGSQDDTVATLEQIPDSRLRVLSHSTNLGMSSARATGVSAARGAWTLVLDSDWELYPHALSRLEDLISELPEDVRVVWYRLSGENGAVSPAFVPKGKITYRERLEWNEAEGGTDAGRCVRATVYDRTPYIYRHGAMDPLYELDLARNETALFTSDVLGIRHFDASNSYLRQSNARQLRRRLFAEATDMLWMAETALERHGEALAELNPSLYAELLQTASRYAFLLGRRVLGLRYARLGLRRRPFDFTIVTGSVLGLCSPHALVAGVILRRKAAEIAARR